MTCSLFGHADTPDAIRGKLIDTLTDLIEHYGADLFYVGNHGNFDRMAASVLCELKSTYPHINFYIVLAYLPEHSCSNLPTLFPEGIENVPKRFAIDFRNKFMVEQSEIIAAYVKRSFGGAAKFVDMARRKNKTIINIAE